MKDTRKKQKTFEELMDRDLKAIFKKMGCKDAEIKKQLEIKNPKPSECLRNMLEDKNTQKLLDKMLPCWFSCSTNEDESVLTISMKWATKDGYALLKGEYLKRQVIDTLKEAIAGKLHKGGNNAKKSKTSGSKKARSKKR